ncbi:MAG: hypothetical protein Q8K92_04470 [Leadbetterella sp.]|nr:hypothetical protein [Leadbetterella sp.]
MGNKVSKLKYFLGFYQIVGGLGGVFMIIVNVNFYSLDILLALTLFSLTTLSGFYYFNGNRYLKILLLLSLVLQIVNYKSYLWGFNFKAGAEFSIYIDRLKIDFAFFTFKFEMSTQQLNNHVFSLNIVPILLIFFVRSFLQRFSPK